MPDQATDHRNIQSSWLAGENKINCVSFLFFFGILQQSSRIERTCSSVSCFEMVSFSIFLIFFMSLLTWNSCSCSRCCSNSAFSCWSCSSWEKDGGQTESGQNESRGERVGEKSTRKGSWWVTWKLFDDHYELIHWRQIIWFDTESPAKQEAGVITDFLTSQNKKPCRRSHLATKEAKCDSP